MERASTKDRAATKAAPGIDDALREFDRAMTQLRRAQAEAGRALERLTAAGGDVPAKARPAPALRPPASRPDRDLTSPRAIATQMALEGTTREQTSERLTQLFEFEFEFELGNLLDDVFHGGRSPRRGLRRRVGKRRRATDAR